MTPENPSAATRRDWYPVARAVDLEPPQQVTLLGRRLVAFRTADGRPRVLLDRCLHRGGTLHRGAVIGESIECPYHGWQWRGADGRARMLDAYCRHLGANMAFGGRVHGDYLECPFHSWRYDGSGTVRE